VNLGDDGLSGGVLGLLTEHPSEKSNIVRLRQQGEIVDPLTNILHSGARQLLAQAAEMEAEAFLAAMKDMKLPAGRDRHGPAREIQTGIGKSALPWLCFRDRRGGRRAWMRSCRCSTCAAFRRRFPTGLISGLAFGRDPDLPFIVAPMGHPAVLLFAVPASPLAQP
jgi:hypothetical protein